MSAQDTAGLVWYLARDGQQYGPISSTELAKLVELGHLRDGDLVWNQTFTEWQPASVAVAAVGPKPAPPEPPPAAPAQPAPTAQPGQAGPATGVEGVPPARDADPAGMGRDPSPRDLGRQDPGHQDPGRQNTTGAAGTAFPGNQADSRDMDRRPDLSGSRPGVERGATPDPSHMPRAPRSRDSRSRDRSDDAYTAQTQPQSYASHPAGSERDPSRAPSFEAGHKPEFRSPAGHAAEKGRSQAAPAASDPTLDAADALEGQHAPVRDEPQRRAVISGDEAYDYDDADDASGGFASLALKVAATAIVIGVVAALAWFGYQNRDAVLAMMDGRSPDGPVPVVSATDTGNGSMKVRTTATESISPGTGESPGNSDAAVAQHAKVDLFQTGLWENLEKTFPSWAQERRKRVADLQGSNSADNVISRYLVTSIAKLRRQNANSALSAEPSVLRSLASSFLANLRSLTARGPQACYAFISKGETAPEVIALVNDPKLGPPLRKQMGLVVAAIESGKENPKTYLPPRQDDYSMISSELTKMGWTDGDMKLFGDPGALAKAKPAKVCQLVTDWFTAQLMVSDPEIQSRLLVQSLRPVVAG